MRVALQWSHRELESKSGVNYGKIQRFESSLQSSLPVEDIAALLEALGSSMARYFGQVGILKELEVLKEDVELAEKFKKALKIPAKRLSVKTLLDALFADEPRPDKTLRGSRVRPSAPSGGRSER